MPTIQNRTFVLESPSVTADQLVWESYAEVVRAAGTTSAGEPVVFQNGSGTYVRYVEEHDPSEKRAIAGVLHVAKRRVQRAVALTQLQAKAEGADLFFCVPGQPTYGRAGVWLRNGVKPEVDPGLYYAEQHRRHLADAGDLTWEPLSASEQAAFLEQQRKARQSTATTQVVVDGAAEQQDAQEPAATPAPTGRRGA